MPEKLVKSDSNVLNDKMERLRNLMPEVFSEGKFNYNKFAELFSAEVDESPESYSFTWAGKRDALKMLQSKSFGALIPDKQESIDFDNTQNIFIEGDNLEVLKLLKSSYFGKVKMIYIDPPYNTGGDFVYRDNFKAPLEQYKILSGQKDIEGNVLTTNSDKSGHYHATWLSMMYPRLFIARQMLKEDGFIFVSIDDHELHNLRMLMNEIFGEQCFKNCIIFRRGAKNVQAQFDTVDSLTVGHEYIVVYAKNASARFKKLYIDLDDSRQGSWNNHWRGTDRPSMRYELFGIKPPSGQWRWSEAKSLAGIANYERMINELGGSQEITQEQIDAWYKKEVEETGEDVDLLRLSHLGKPEHYIAPSDTKLGSDLWVDLSPLGSSQLKALFGKKVFDNPKPTELIKRMLAVVTENSDIVMDFFAGSASTAQAVIEYNRDNDTNLKFITIQIPEATSAKSAARKEGFNTISDLAKERIRKILKQLAARRPEDRIDAEDLGFKVFKLVESHYRQWNGLDSEDSDAYLEQIEMFADPLVDGWEVENLIYELTLQEGLSLNCKISKKSSVANNDFYVINDELTNRKFYICLDDKLEFIAVQRLKLSKDDILICRAIALDDTTAANIDVQCRLKTI